MIRLLSISEVISMNIYNVNPDFIKKLRNKYKTIMLHKGDLSSNGGRKYLGVAFEFNEMNFYIPISSPSDKDYIIGKDGLKKAKKENAFSMYMKHLDNKGNEIIDSVLNIGNMIPVPKNELRQYSIVQEKNPYYKNKFLNLYKFLKKNEEKIKKKAGTIFYMPKELTTIDYRGLLREVYKYTFQELIWRYNKNKPIKDREFYFKQKKWVVCEQSDCGKYFAMIPSKKRRKEEYDKLKLCTIEKDKIIELDSLEKDINEQGIKNLKKIIDGKIKKDCEIGDLPTEEVKFDDIENTNKNITPKPKLKNIAKDNSKVMDLE